jgi:hypothetical protein
MFLSSPFSNTLSLNVRDQISQPNRTTGFDDSNNLTFVGEEYEL